ncbi:MAG: hypothetical protein C4527_20105 [Candidatus Omnitrophota bacterium]|jgi:hypothetical protein|nr:MAG: hypothetical protein C4527_20105 [Candidatus Omnitrophota bacterium]
MRIYFYLRLLLLVSMLFMDGMGANAQGIGPTDEEQWMLELINRARMDPTAEGIRLANHADEAILNAYRFFGVNVETLKREFSNYPPRAPLAMNEQLLEAARRHSADMRDHRFQDHIGSDGSVPGQRLDDAGYDWRGYGENVYAYGENVEHAHAAFVVDWGVASLGHRQNTLEFEREPLWREVGIGIVRTVSAKVLNSTIKLRKHQRIAPAGVIPKQADAVGPLLVTIDFAVPFAYTPQLLGVVYADLNGNQWYDIGEGLGGVTVAIMGSTRSASTFSSGGYAIPVSAAGEYSVEASGGPLPSPLRKTFVFDGSNNVKVDFAVSDETGVPDWRQY